MRVVRWGVVSLVLLFVGGIVVGACVDAEGHFVEGVDGDQDGYEQEIDCDDTDRAIHPDAVERENCLDDNCDGQVDEGTPNEDRDHDTFCPSTGDIGDCEGNPSRYPGQAEDFGGTPGEPNGVDDNCNGIVDDGLAKSDIDKDGFTLADGDCNDNDPTINPGAIEVVGRQCRKATDCPNGKCYGGYCRCLKDDDCSSGDACTGDSQCTKPGEKCVDLKCKATWVCLSAKEGMERPELKVCRDNADNDCDGKRDELPMACDKLSDLDQKNALDYARAIELCDTGKTCDMDKKCPGHLLCAQGKCRRVLEATFDPKGAAKARAIVAEFAEGGPLKPKKNHAMVVISSGLAVYDPRKVCPQDGTDYGIVGVEPDPMVSDRVANDLTQFQLKILVPTNARSFSFDFQFLTTEYPDYLGTEFNDTFWVLLDSKKYKGNICFDKAGTPIRLNNAFFDICDPDPGYPKTKQYCTLPAALLTGTGYAKDCGSPLACSGISCGGSTGWLTTTSPVEPGEVITLTFFIFDKGDGILDSSALIDNFRWSLVPALKPITGPD